MAENLGPQERSLSHSDVDWASCNAQVGIATEFWLELEELMPDTPRSLWLKVAGEWCRLDDPSDSIQSSVQHAFASDRFEVKVWYYQKLIGGLVVKTIEVA